MITLENDLRDFIEALNKAEVRYLIVGGYAVIFHGYGRFTMDIDIWVEKSLMNYQKIQQAFQIFGMPTFGMTQENFLNNPEVDVFTFGQPPCAINLMIDVKGLEFTTAYANSTCEEFDGIVLRFVSKSDLFQTKKAAGRTKDKLDLEELGAEL